MQDAEAALGAARRELSRLVAKSAGAGPDTVAAGGGRVGIGVGGGAGGGVGRRASADSAVGGLSADLLRLSESWLLHVALTVVIHC